jgi:hypothetical protein
LLVVEDFLVVVFVVLAVVFEAVLVVLDLLRELEPESAFAANNSNPWAKVNASTAASLGKEALIFPCLT